MSWTNERTELLKQLWADGVSAGQIAIRLKDVSRNAVIGKVRRLRLAGRATTSCIRAARPRSNIALLPAPSLKAQQSRFGDLPVRKALATGTVVRLPPILPELYPGPDSHVGIGQLKDCMCAWPIGDPKRKDFHFCGRPRTLVTPYCEHHAAIAYNPSARKRRAA
jgi:GcrA cell cycle regulator